MLYRIFDAERGKIGKGEHKRGENGKEKESDSFTRRRD
jgi:hypothetical protein